jgi:hypothetical protein
MKVDEVQNLRVMRMSHCIVGKDSMTSFRQGTVTLAAALSFFACAKRAMNC